jgi:N6-adenosine-specific RNA methylase IME4
MAAEPLALHQIAVEIRKDLDIAKQGVATIRIGGRLRKAKRQLRHGQWGAWLSRNFDWSERSARRFMDAHKRFGNKPDTVSDLPPRVLFVLAAPSTPDETVDRVLNRKQAGEKITIAYIKQENAAQSTQGVIMRHGSEKAGLRARRGLRKDAHRRAAIEAKQKRRAERERELAERQRALPTKKYGVIVADPEWRFEPYSRVTGMDRAADNHYPTSELDAIKARDVPSIAANDCVLFLWATVPMLPQALDVMTNWGFTYKTSFVWNKNRIGTGYWNRNKHEYLLVGTRGKIPAPAPGTQWDSVIEAPTGKHSEKPEASLEMVEAYFPSLPKIELNRRGSPREGWDAWGNEVVDRIVGGQISGAARRRAPAAGEIGGNP